MTQTPLNTVTSQVKTRHEFCSERPMFKQKQMYCSEVNEGELVENAMVSPDSILSPNAEELRSQTEMHSEKTQANCPWKNHVLLIIRSH